MAQWLRIPITCSTYSSTHWRRTVSRWTSQPQLARNWNCLYQCSAGWISPRHFQWHMPPNSAHKSSHRSSQRHFLASNPTSQRTTWSKSVASLPTSGWGWHSWTAEPSCWLRKWPLERPKVRQWCWRKPSTVLPRDVAVWGSWTIGTNTEGALLMLKKSCQRHTLLGNERQSNENISKISHFIHFFKNKWLLLSSNIVVYLQKYFWFFFVFSKDVGHANSSNLVEDKKYLEISVRGPISGLLFGEKCCFKQVLNSIFKKSHLQGKSMTH